MKTASSALDFNATIGQSVGYDWDFGTDVYEDNPVIQALRRYGFESPAIVQSYFALPALLYDYIHTVRKARWPEAEPALQKDKRIWLFYADEFLGGAAATPDMVQGLRDDVGAPHEASSKTASAILDFAGGLCLGAVLGRLKAQGLLTDSIKRAMAEGGLDPADAINAARTYGRRWPELEPLLAEDPGIAAGYALDVLKTRFPAGESRFSQEAASWRHPYDTPSYVVRYYVAFVLHEDPDAALKDDDWTKAWNWARSLNFAPNQGVQASGVARTASSSLHPTTVLGFRYTGSRVVPALDRTGLMTRGIASAASACIPLIVWALKNDEPPPGGGTWEAREPTILRSVEATYFYMLRVKQDWPVGRDAVLMSQDPKFIALTAMYVLKARWPEAEPYIAQLPGYANDYATKMLGYRQHSKIEAWRRSMARVAPTSQGETSRL